MGFTTIQAAEILNVTPRFVSRLCKKGILKATMHGRDWDIEPESVYQYRDMPKNKGGRPKKTGTERSE